ncbi:MAG: oligosaccharide flippase family protein [Planktothrix sp.]|uniref:oligosaccharide flippase family protein n=3 Tax=Planktothrix sp. TaxID=3088171 RepID=UPI0038D45F9E
MASLSKKAIQGTIWTLFGYGGSQVLRFGGNLILTRLLLPELFGLIALVNTFITGLNLFSDIGIRPSIIRSQRGDDPEFLNTAWTIQVFRGLGLWIICLLITVPLAKFYNEPELLWITPIVGFRTVIAGFESTSLASLNRHLNLKTLTIYDFIVQGLSLGVMILWAWISPNIWALIVGVLISSLFGLIRSHYLNTGMPNRFAWDQSALKELISFGRWIFVSTVMTFLASQSDRLILGKLLTLEMLGVYTVAFALADLPKSLMQAVMGKVVFPVISKQLDLPRSQLRQNILDKRKLLLLMICFPLAILVCFGDQLILSLYDQRYEQAAWMLPILALGMWPFILHSSINKALFAIGKPLYIALGNVFKLLYMVILLPLSFSMMGVLGAIIVVAFNDIPSYIVVNYGLWQEELLGLKQDLGATFILLGMIVLLGGIRYALGGGLSIDSVF